jgi:transcriptional regulator with XRE-family HTH domain
MPKIAKIHADKRPIRIHYLVEWLETRHMIQADLEKLVGVNKATVSKWCGGSLPSEKNLLLICDALSIEPNDLFRHPKDDWLSKLFANHKKEDSDRLKIVIENALPRKSG